MTHTPTPSFWQDLQAAIERQQRKCWACAQPAPNGTGREPLCDACQKRTDACTETE